jgi:hypothetical protein
MPLTVNISYPKVRDVYTKVIPILRTDNATVKCVLPKNAVVTNVMVNQTSNAVTGAGSFSLGWSGSANALINAFSMATTKVGLVAPGTAVGASVGTQLTEDKQIISTYTVGTSTAGGEGYVLIEYFVPGAGEGMYD